MKGSTVLVVFLVVTSQGLIMHAALDNQSLTSRDESVSKYRNARSLSPEFLRSMYARTYNPGKPYNLLDDEDHTNVDLDKINEAIPFDVSGLPAFVQPLEPQVGGEFDRKTRMNTKEYRFVPITMYNPVLQRNWRLADKLRDMILNGGSTYSFYPEIKDKSGANNIYETKEIDRQLSPYPKVAHSKLNAREKRRRCKGDPNLGIKNPAYCDSESFFGAADYGVRDMWDSAGR